MRRIVVNIDSLVLKGFRYEDRHAIAQGLQQQLATLFAGPGMVERLVQLRLGRCSASADEVGAHRRSRGDY